jgi:hypothetical protein
MRIWPVLLGVAASAAALTTAWAASTPAATPEAAESVTVTATPLPHRSAVDEFIYSYPTEVRTTDKIARWKAPICPVVQGLPARFASFITTRVKAIAHTAGAPVSEDPKCRHNIEILFTTAPQTVGDWLRKDHWAYLGYFDNFHQADELAKVTHDIQAWYTTATVGYHGLQRVDNPRGDFLYAGLNTMPGTESMGGGAPIYYAPGAGRFNVGPASSLYNVIIVANPARLGEYEMGALADYIAMLALSQPKSFDACWEVPSITNLLTKDCQAERKTATLSDNDARFLYGLYKMDANYAVQIQRSQIRYFMEHRSSDKH